MHNVGWRSGGLGGEGETQQRNEEHEQQISPGRKLQGMGRKMKEEVAICSESCRQIEFRGLGLSRVGGEFSCLRCHSQEEGASPHALCWEGPVLSPGTAVMNPNSSE